MKKFISVPDDISPQAAELVFKLLAFDKKFPGALQREFLDFLDIVEIGAQKYALNNWLTPNGGRCSRKDNHDSMFHHLSESYVLGKRTDIYDTLMDIESGMHPLLHLITRGIFGYVRDVRGIQHEED